MIIYLFLSDVPTIYQSQYNLQRRQKFCGGAIGSQNLSVTVNET